MLLENGSMLSCSCIACFGRQHGVDGRTPRTVAIYKSARLEPIPEPSRCDMVAFYASVGTDWEFLCELFIYAICEGLAASRYTPVVCLSGGAPFLYLG